MRFVSKYSLVLICFLGFSLIYFLLRLYHLGSLPIFTDEAIYIRWAQIAKLDASWRFISLTDGKQPLFIWIMIVIMKFVKDPLIAGRLVSVFAGFFSMIGMFFLGNEFFQNKKIGIVSSLLYIVYPFALVYDRMALYDTLVGTFAIWSLFFLVLVVRNLRLDFAMILGLISGGGVLTKTSGFFTVYLLPLSLLLFQCKEHKQTFRLVKLILLWLTITFLTYACYTILRLSPFFHIIDEKNALFVYPFKEWLQHPFTFYFGNLMGVLNWYQTYTTWPFVLITLSAFFIKEQKTKENIVLLTLSLGWLLTFAVFELYRAVTKIDVLYLEYINFLLIACFVVYSFYVSIKNKSQEKLFLLLWFFLPFTTLALFGKVIYPRFIFFMVLALIPLTAYSLVELFYLVKNKYVYIVVLLILSILPFRSMYYILTNFTIAPIPFPDIAQYSNDWPAGGGIKEAVAFFQNSAQTGKIFVGTEGTFGLLPFSFEIYLKDNQNIELKGYWPISDTIPKELIEKSKRMPTYVVFYQPCPSCHSIGEAPQQWPLRQAYQFKKYFYNRFLTVYQVVP